MANQCAICHQQVTTGSHRANLNFAFICNACYAPKLIKRYDLSSGSYAGLGTPDYHTWGEHCYQLAGTELIITIRADSSLKDPAPICDEAGNVLHQPEHDWDEAYWLIEQALGEQDIPYTEADRARDQRHREGWDDPLEPRKHDSQLH